MLSAKASDGRGSSRVDGRGHPAADPRPVSALVDGGADVATAAAPRVVVEPAGSLAPPVAVFTDGELAPGVADGLLKRGHDLGRVGYDGSPGHEHAIQLIDGGPADRGTLAAATDPRRRGSRRSASARRDPDGPPCATVRPPTTARAGPGAVASAAARSADGILRSSGRLRSHRSAAGIDAPGGAVELDRLPELSLHQRDRVRPRAAYRVAGCRAAWSPLALACQVRALGDQRRDMVARSDSVSLV